MLPRTLSGAYFVIPVLKVSLQLKNFTNWFAENPSSAFVYSPILKASTGHTYQVNDLKNFWINIGLNTFKINIFAFEV